MAPRPVQTRVLTAEARTAAAPTVTAFGPLTRARPVPQAPQGTGAVRGHTLPFPETTRHAPGSQRARLSVLPGGGTRPESSKSRHSDPLQVTDISASLAPGGQPEKEGRLQQCAECGRSFASAALLLQHSKEAHGRERIHVCAVCRKAFKRATHLKVRPRPRPPPGPRGAERARAPGGLPSPGRPQGRRDRVARPRGPRLPWPQAPVAPAPMAPAPVAPSSRGPGSHGSRLPWLQAPVAPGSRGLSSHGPRLPHHCVFIPEAVAVP